MPDLETRLPDLLRDLSTEMPLDDRSAGVTLVRARRRRFANAAGATALAVVLVAGSLAALRSVTSGDRTQILGTPSPTIPGPSLLAIDAPLPVVQTRSTIADAISQRDIDALAEVIDRNTFSYNLDDGGDPIPVWKDDPSVLDPIPSLFLLPPAEPKVVPTYGTVYVFPYLVDSDFSSLSAGELRDLRLLGIDDATIERMVRAGRYTGPRLSIAAGGAWLSYSTSTRVG